MKNILWKEHSDFLHSTFINRHSNKGLRHFVILFIFFLYSSIDDRHS